MRNVDVVHGDPEQTGRNLPHQLARNVNRKLVGARECPRMGLEFVYRKFQNLFELIEFEFASTQFRRIERGLVVIAQQVLGSPDRRKSPRLANAWADEPERPALIHRSDGCFPDAVEAIAGRDDPRI